MKQAYRLESVDLHQVGVFDDVHIDFKPIESEAEDAKKAEIHLFTGPNGCGKSTVLYALARIFEPLQDTGAGNVPRFLVYSRFRDRKESSVQFSFAGNKGEYSSLPPSRIDLPARPFETPLNSVPAFSYSGHRDLHDVSLRDGIKESHISGYAGALSFTQSIRPEILIHWIASNRTKRALALADEDSPAAKAYDGTLNRITDFVRDICDLDIEFRLDRMPYLHVQLLVDGINIGFSALPDGLKSIISWVADLSMRLESIYRNEEDDAFIQPIIIFLDEIDIHLHPKWQRRILPAVQKLLPNAQIFASTHSPFVVGSVEDAWVYRLPEPIAGHTSGTIEGIPSGAGKSYQLILEEVFDVDEEFDVETEKLFDVFYTVRDSVLKTKKGIDLLLEAAQSLASRSEEASLIIHRELKQASRLLGQEISLAQD